MAAGFPSHDIDPRKKNFDWILQFVKAAWNNGHGGLPDGMAFRGRQRYAEIKKYTLGQQNINKHKKVTQADKAQDKSDWNNDHTVVPILCQFREKAISRVLAKKYDIECFAVDPLSKSEEDRFFTEMKLKIQMREAALAAGDVEAANHPEIAPQVGEPEDMEQLAMTIDFGYKNNKALQSEMAVDYLHQYNNASREDKAVVMSEYDFGIGGYKAWVDDNGIPRYRAINPESLIVSYCEKPDFSDAMFIGEVIDVNLVDLAPYFSAVEMAVICDKVKGQYGNPTTFDQLKKNFYENFKVQVVDLEFLSYDTTVYKQKLDKRGNVRFGKTDYQDIDKTTNVHHSGEAEPKYLKNTKKNLYRTKWIVGTSMMYDYGLAKNQPRKLSSWWDVSFSFVIEAWNFYKMQFAGVTERLIPLADEYHETRMKLQNIKKKLIPYSISINESALENVNFGNGGEKWSTKQLLDFFFQNYILLHRTDDLDDANGGKQPNPIDVKVTGMVADLLSIRQEMDRIKLDCMDMAGLNEVTTGNANPRMLTTGLELANQATNESLSLISESTKSLKFRLSDLLIQLLQCAVANNKVTILHKAMGSDTVKTFDIDPEIANREFGIFMQEAATMQDRQMLLQDLNLKDSQGLIDPSDKIMVWSCRNVKQAGYLLAYKVRKRKEQAEKHELEKINLNNQGASQAALQAEEAKRQTAQIMTEFDIQKINTEKQWEYEIEKMKKEYDSNDTSKIVEGKVMAQQIAADSKRHMAAIK